jgi:ABC-type multidrug transport system fused ATPase/permease subunit
MNLVWRVIRDHLPRHWRSLVVRFIVASTVASTPYAFSMLGKWVVDDVLQVTGMPKVAATDAPVWVPKSEEEKIRLLVRFLAISLGIHVAVTVASAGSELLNCRMNEKLAMDLRSAVNEKLAGMEMGLFTREQVGQLMSRTIDDTGAIPGNLTNFVVNLATQAGMLILGVVLLVRLSPTMALVVLGTMPFYALSCAIFLPQLRRAAQEQRERWAAMGGYALERLTNVATVKNYAQEQRETAEFEGWVDRNLAIARHQHRLNLYFGTLTTIVTGVGTLAVLWMGFLGIRSGQMQLGEVLAFYAVAAQLFVPLSALISLTTVVQAIGIHARRVYEILDFPERLQNAPDAVDLPESVRGEIEFRNVSLQYTEGGPFAVQGVDLRVPAGNTVCLVGSTGCGKSTLLSLVSRLYDPTDGEILLDGIPLRKLRLRQLRRAIGDILHDCDVFSGTIAENLRFGAPRALRRDLEQAARDVGLDEFIRSLPKGYDTPVGRQGLGLSEEQLVRFAVARALITKPIVLTIDDTFSVVERAVEEQLRRAIRSPLANRTVLIGTSRLSICKDADLVVVMQRGRVVDQGTHQELMSRPGVYRRMYLRQAGQDASIRKDRPD